MSLEPRAAKVLNERKKNKKGGRRIYSFYSVIAIAGKLRIIRRINLISMEFIVLGPKAVKIYKVRKAGGVGIHCRTRKPYI